jgi:hypothetical protein
LSQENVDCCALYSATKTPDKSIYKEEMFILAHSLRDSSPLLTDPVAFVSVTRQQIMVVAWSRTSYFMDKQQK